MGVPIEFDADRRVVLITGPGEDSIEIGAGHDPFDDGYGFFDFPVAASGVGLAANTSVRSIEGPAGLRVFFRTLADDWKGEKRDAEWESIEHDLTIRVQHDSLGHVRLTFVLHEDYKADTWRAEVTVPVEAGQEMADLADALDQLLTVRPE